MAQYIPKDVLLAVLEKLVDKGKYHEEYDCAFRDGNNAALDAVKGKVNTIEVKEVDIEKEIEYEYNPVDGLSFEEFRRIAKYFFELGFQAQKGK